MAQQWDPLCSKQIEEVGHRSVNTEPVQSTRHCTRHSRSTAISEVLSPYVTSSRVRWRPLRFFLAVTPATSFRTGQSRSFWSSAQSGRRSASQMPTVTTSRPLESPRRSRRVLGDRRGLGWKARPLADARPQVRITVGGNGFEDPTLLAHLDVLRDCPRPMRRLWRTIRFGAQRVRQPMPTPASAGAPRRGQNA